MSEFTFVDLYPHYQFDLDNIDPNGEYSFHISELGKANAFKDKYPNATVSIHLFDATHTTDTMFNADVQLEVKFPTHED